MNKRNHSKSYLRNLRSNQQKIEKTLSYKSLETNNTKLGRAKLILIYNLIISSLFLNTSMNLFAKKFNQITSTDALPENIQIQKITFLAKIFSEFLFGVEFKFESNGFNMNKKSLFIAEHQSLLEEIIAGSSYNPAFAYHDEFAKIPIAGAFVKYVFDNLKYVGVSSKKIGSIDGMIESIEQNLWAGRSFQYYPEGQINSIDDENIKSMPGGTTKILSKFFKNEILNSNPEKINSEIPIVCTNTGLLFNGKTRVRKIGSDKLDEIQTLKTEAVAKITKDGIILLKKSKFKNYFIKNIRKWAIFQNELLNLTGNKYENFNEAKDDIEKNFDQIVSQNLIPFMQKKIDLLKEKRTSESKKWFFEKNTRSISDFSDNINGLEKQITSLKDPQSQNYKKTKDNIKKDICAVLQIYQKYNDSDKNFDNLGVGGATLTAEEKANFCRKSIDFIFRIYNKQVLGGNGFELSNVNEEIFKKDNAQNV